MIQRFRNDLAKYRDLFTGKRCSGWELEELIVAAIKADTQVQHHVKWQKAGHDDMEDIFVRTNGKTHAIQIKSGQIKNRCLVLSGPRLGRFDGKIKAISEYLKTSHANIISIPYRKVDDEQGRKHVYRLCYVDVDMLTELDSKCWVKHGAQHIQTNRCGVGFSLRPSMS